MSKIVIESANLPEELDDVLSIYREYIHNTSTNLDFQNNEKDFLTLSEQYSESHSVIYLAKHQGEVIGCGAYRRVNAEICEMKKVYVKPSYREKGIGVNIIKTVIEGAKRVSYRKICLDVLPEFSTAISIYENLGFKPSPPITFNPVAGTKFLELSFDKASQVTQR